MNLLCSKQTMTIQKHFAESALTMAHLSNNEGDSESLGMLEENSPKEQSFVD